VPRLRLDRGHGVPRSDGLQWTSSGCSSRVGVEEFDYPISYGLFRGVTGLAVVVAVDLDPLLAARLLSGVL
jgi:hypothetical protein